MKIWNIKSIYYKPIKRLTNNNIFVLINFHFSNFIYLQKLNGKLVITYLNSQVYLFC